MGIGPTRPTGEPGPVPHQGWVTPHIAAEFPGLGVSWIETEAAPGKSPESVRARLRALSDRFYGSHAITMRERPIPWAYRVFFRQIGLDPDSTRTPIEQLAFERLRDGAFLSAGLPTDALTIATVETGVALRAVDADRIEGRLGIRASAPGESLAGGGALAQGTLILADEVAPAGLLFGETAPAHRVESGCRRVAVVAIAVHAVPRIAVEEALWMAAGELAEP